MAEKLTPQQHMAVTNRGGKLLVSAAAGSGKTKVLVDRLMMYLTDPEKPANIDEFLIITYTKAAAAELRGKIAAKLSERIAECPDNRHLQRQLQRLYMTNISTVHSFCSDILRQFAYQLELSADFRVADERECASLQDAAMEQILEEAYANAENDPQFCAFIDTQGIGRNDRKVPVILLQVYRSAQCHLAPEGWLDRCIETCNLADCTDVSETVWGKYLMNELFDYLDLQIAAMERCAQLAEQSENMEGAARLLWDTVNQLRHLRASTTWDEIVQRRVVEYGTLKFSSKIADLELAEGIKAVRNACKKGLEKYLKKFVDDSHCILKDLHISAEAIRGMIQQVRNFKKVYDSLKRRRRVLDFSDLEHLTLDLFLGKKRGGPTAIAKEIGRRFREVMVDEYQDSNEVQDAIYSALTSQQNNCFMVGDVKQSIYQFRLADPGIFLEKYATYLPASEAAPGQGRKVMLSRNFRSSGAVLEAVNSVFEICMTPDVGGLYYGEEEALYEGIPHEPLGEPEIELYAIEVVDSDTYAEEASFTAKRICELLDGTHCIRTADGQRPIRPDDIVILLRSPGTTGEEYQKALERRGIRCSFGDSGDLLSAKEIVVLRSLLQTVYNPQLDIPLLAVLTSPLFCFSADDLAALRSQHRNRSIYQALLKDTSPKTVDFLNQLAQLREDARVKNLTQLMETIFAVTRIDSIYGAMEEGAVRRENLQSFYQLAVEFENGGQRDLGRFLKYLDSMDEKGLLAAGETSNAGCVTIMSIHKSKGLEFPVVFLCSLSHRFNKENQRAQVLCDKELGIGVLAVDSRRRVRYPTLAKKAIASKMERDSLSEELRILYVAMTRARDRLIMTYASDSLEKELTAMAARTNMGCTQLLTRDVSCPGKWVLMSALMRTESGELFRLGGSVSTAVPGSYPWLVRVVSADKDAVSEPVVEIKETISSEEICKIQTGLNDRYPHMDATITPSKQTATQRKGRTKDQEIAENTQEPKVIHRIWRKPSFIERSVDAASYGTAIHAVLQYMNLAHGISEAGIRNEVINLTKRGILSIEQSQLVECKKLAAFFTTSLGKKVISGDNVLREFKFSILDDGSAVAGNLSGEKILLQGVVDCALIEDDGITVIDFKTDRIKAEQTEGAVERYRPQILAYTDALRRIFCKNIKGAYLYFLEINQFIEILM